LLPDLVGAIHLQVSLPDPLDVRHQLLVTLGTDTAQGRVAYPRGMTSISRRGNLQHLADRLDPKGLPVQVDEGHYLLV
jgi:hypothetical protein